MYNTEKINGVSYTQYPEINGYHIYIDSSLHQDLRQHLHHFLEEQEADWFTGHIGIHGHFKYPGTGKFFEMLWRSSDHIAVLVHDSPSS
ncbi:MAG: hypothetical protein WCV88_05125 [Patescibacteria group bacterium]|jgi:hypothetical protein